MALMNINAGASGNPLDALLAGRAMWGNAGGMLYTQNGFGPDAFNVGSYAPDGSTPSDVLTTDPRYFYQTTTQGSEGGGGDRVYKLNPQTLTKLNGRVQLRNTTIGGPGGVIDPSKVSYDPEFGLVTDPSNINAVGETFLDKYGPWILASPALAAVGGAAMAGVGEGAGGAGAAGISGSNALATGGFGTDIAAGSGTFAGAGASGAASTLGNLSSGGGFDADGVWHDIPTMDNVQAGTLNPMGPDATPLGSSNGSSLLSQLNTARQYLGGANSVMNLLSGGSRSGSSGMGSNDLSSILSALFGGGSGGSGTGGLLGLLAGLHQGFGGGLGTASGAQQTAQQASALADPWGSSGQRAAFSSLLTPDKVMSLLSQDPSAITSNPAYQFDLSQGIGAINQGDAAQGTLRSGNRGYELENYGQGLAAKYGQQFFNNNLSSLGILSNLAGVNAGSPGASAQMLMGGFDNASNLRNAGVNSLFSGGSSNPLLSLLGGNGSNGGGLLSLFSGGVSGIGSLLGSLFGGDTSTDSTINDFISGGIGEAGDFTDLSGGFPF